MKPLQRIGVFGWLALAALAGAACDPNDACDSGYYEEHGACIPVPRSEDAGSMHEGDSDDDGGAEPDASDDAAPASDPYEGSGDDCDDASDCREGLICGAPQLALCTQVNCMEDPSICPPDWTCFDTTGVSPDPSVTSVCLNF